MSKPKSFLQVAAERRAKVIAALNQEPGMYYTAEELTGLLPSERDATSLQSLLYNLAKNGLIGKAKVEGRNVYCSTRQPAPEEKVRKPRKPRKVHGQPQMLIEYVKSTGRARVTIGGIVLEIGVADS